MKIKLSISQKLQLYIISVTAIFMMSALLFVNFKSQQIAIENGKKYSEELASKYAKEIEQKLNNDLIIVRTLSHVMSLYRAMPDSGWMNVVPTIYHQIAKNNPQIDNIWDSWEMSAYNPNYKKPYGRFSMSVVNSPKGQIYSQEYQSLSGDSKLYAENKAKNKEHLEEPYLYAFDGDKNHEVLITDITSPIQDLKGNYVGMVGADIRLEKLQLLVNKITPFENSSAYLISNKGLYTSHPDVNLVGSTAVEDFKVDDILYQIKRGNEFKFTQIEDGQEYYYIFKPIEIGETHAPWSLGLKIPVEHIVSQAKTESRVYLIFGIFIILSISTVIAFATRKITKPLRAITKVLLGMSEGSLSKDMLTNYQTGDEIEEISTALNRFIKGLSDKAVFAEEIGKQHYDNQLELLSDKDSLGKSLVEMQKSLIDAQISEEKRLKEDEKRKWANEGLAKFSDILRQNANSIGELSTIFIRELVKFNKANQATLFLLEEGVYRAKATYAYDRDKYYLSEIQPGEGLVGTCIIERKPIYLTDIPNGYIKITSGLGQATPNALFICPIQTEKEVLGVIEIASFNVFEAYQRTFIETTCTNLASVVEAVKVNENTKLLLEQTQQQTEEMKAQEEEMRQNLEELQATQEEIAKKSSEMASVLTALNASSLVIKLGLDGTIMDINDSFAALLLSSKHELMGQNFREFAHLQCGEDEFSQLAQNLATGQSVSVDQKMLLKNGEELWVSQVFSAIFNEYKDPESIMGIGMDITANKQLHAELIQQNEQMAAQEEMMRLNFEEFEQIQTEFSKKSDEVTGLMNALNMANFVVEYNLEGQIIEINETYLNFLGIDKEEALALKQSDYITAKNKDKNDFVWQTLLEGNPWKGSMHLTMNDIDYTLIETYTPIFNMDGELVKILKIANNIDYFEL